MREFRDGPPQATKAAHNQHHQRADKLSSSCHGTAPSSGGASFSTSALLKEISSLKSRLKDLEDDTRSSVLSEDNRMVMEEKERAVVLMLRKELAKVEQQKANLEKEFMNQLTNMANENRSTVGDLQDKLVRSQALNEELKGQLKNELRNGARENDEAEQRLVQLLETERDSHNREMEQMKQTLASSDEEIADNRREIDHLHSHLDEVESEKEELMREVTEIRLAYSEEQRLSETLRTELKQSTDTVSKLQKEMSGKDAELSQRNDEVGEMNDALIELESHKEMLVSEITDLRMQLSRQENLRRRSDVFAPASPSAAAASAAAAAAADHSKCIPLEEKEKLEDDIKLLEGRLERVQAKLAEKDTTIDNLASTLTEERKHTHALKAEVKKLKNGAPRSPKKKNQMMVTPVRPSTIDTSLSPTRSVHRSAPRGGGEGGGGSNKKNLTSGPRTPVSGLVASFEARISGKATNSNSGAADADNTAAGGDAISSTTAAAAAAASPAAPVSRHSRQHSRNGAASGGVSDRALQATEAASHPGAAPEESEAAADHLTREMVIGLQETLRREKDQVKEQRETIKELHDKLRHEKEVVRDLRLDLEAAQEEDSDTRKERDELQAKVNDKLDEIARLRAKSEVDAGTLLDLQDKLRHETALVKELRAKLSEANKVGDKAAKLEEQLADSRREVDVLVAKIEGYESARMTLHEKTRKEQSELSKLRMKNHQATSEKRELESKVAASQREVERLKTELSCTLDMYSVHQDEKKDEENEEVERLRLQVSSLQSELSSAMTEIDNLLSEMEGLKNALRTEQLTVQEMRKKSEEGTTVRQNKKMFDSEMNHLKVELTKTQLAKKDLETEYAKRVKELEDELIALESEAEEEIDERERQLDSMKEQLAEREARISRLEVEQSQMSKSMNNVSASRQDEMEDLQAELIATTSKTSVQAREIENLKLKIAEQESQKQETEERLKQQIHSLEETIMKHRDQFQLQNDDQLKEENEKLRDALRDVKLERRILKERLDSLTTDKTQSRTTQHLRDRNAALSEQVQTLTKKLKKLEASITRFAI